MINIYVGNLPYSVENGDLIDLFSTYGAITKATVVLDRESGRSKGFGFVELEDRAAGERAIAELGGNPFKGRPLTVNEARPRGSGDGKRVLGDGSGGSAPKAAPGQQIDNETDERLEMRPSASEPIETPTSGGYSNSLIK